MKRKLTGVELIAKERERQVNIEGRTPEHDSMHKNGELAIAGACYAIWDTHAMVTYGVSNISPWPFDEERWKPSNDPVRNLVKAGELIAAEIDRLQNLSNEQEIKF